MKCCMSRESLLELKDLEILIKPGYTAHIAFFLKIFLIWAIFKVFIEFTVLKYCYSIASVLCICFFGQEARS